MTSLKELARRWDIDPAEREALAALASETAAMARIERWCLVALG